MEGILFNVSYEECRGWRGYYSMWATRSVEDGEDTIQCELRGVSRMEGILVNVSYEVCGGWRGYYSM